MLCSGFSVDILQFEMSFWCSKYNVGLLCSGKIFSAMNNQSCHASMVSAIFMLMVTRDINYNKRSISYGELTAHKIQMADFHGN